MRLDAFKINNLVDIQNILFQFEMRNEEFLAICIDRNRNIYGIINKNECLTLIKHADAIRDSWIFIISISKADYFVLVNVVTAIFKI